MEIQGLKTVNIDGTEFWTVEDFSALTQRSDRVIRILANGGNRLRVLKAKRVYGRVFIEANELFDYPFTANGRPSDKGDFIEKFYLEEGELLRSEICLTKDENIDVEGANNG